MPTLSMQRVRSMLFLAALGVPAIAGAQTRTADFHWEKALSAVSRV